jgi:hypothetical protein
MKNAEWRMGNKGGAECDWNFEFRFWEEYGLKVEFGRSSSHQVAVTKDGGWGGGEFQTADKRD